MLKKSFIFSVLLICAMVNAESYRDELSLFVEKSEARFIFDEEGNPSLRCIEQDIENFKALPSTLSRFVLNPLLSLDVVVVTEKSLPKLYRYVKLLCDAHNIPMPAIFITKDAKFFNAVAARLFTGSGGIVIGQGIINNCSDEEVEAIIAHEMAHIKYNHVNKKLALSFMIYFGLQFGLQYALGKVYSQASSFSQSLLHYGMSSVIADIIINKRFEWEADTFACKEACRAGGVVSFLKKLQEKGHKADMDFVRVSAALGASKKNLQFIDRCSLSFDYYLAKGLDTFSKGLQWVYGNTPLGAHPTNEARIAAAQKYLDSSMSGAH